MKNKFKLRTNMIYLNGKKTLYRAVYYKRFFSRRYELLTVWNDVLSNDIKFHDPHSVMYFGDEDTLLTELISQEMQYGR